MSKLFGPEFPEWPGVPAWIASGSYGIGQMNSLRAAGFTEEQAGKIALHICLLDTDGRTEYSKELRAVLDTAKAAVNETPDM